MSTERSSVVERRRQEMASTTETDVSTGTDSSAVAAQKVSFPHGRYQVARDPTGGST